MISQGMNRGRRRGRSVGPSIVEAKILVPNANARVLVRRIASHRIFPEQQHSKPDEVHHSLMSRKGSRKGFARRAALRLSPLDTNPKYTRSQYATRTRAIGTNSMGAGPCSLRAPPSGEDQDHLRVDIRIAHMRASLPSTTHDANVWRACSSLVPPIWESAIFYSDGDAKILPLIHA